MAITLTRPESKSAEVAAEVQQYLDEMPPRRRFTRDEYYRIIEEEYRKIEALDHFVRQKRYQLIDGDIVEKMPHKEPHNGLTMRWLFALAKVFGELFVRCQMPTILSEYSEPEPDILVTKRSREDYLKSSVTPPETDVQLAVEISVSTLRFDTQTKAIMYARAGVRDYWVLDVASRSLIVHRDPTPDGYATMVAYSESGSVSPLAKPEVIFLVSDYLP